MKNCKYCNSILDDNAKYCPSCGKEYTQEEINVEKPTVSTNNTYKPKENTTAKYCSIVALICALISFFSPLLSFLGLFIPIIGMFLTLISLLSIPTLLLGFVLSIIGICTDKEKKYRKFSVWALILVILNVVLDVILLLAPLIITFIVAL